MYGGHRVQSEDVEQGPFTSTADNVNDRLLPGESSHASSSEAPQQTSQKKNRTLLGLGLYGISSLFLATVLMCSKLLSSRGFPVWEILLDRGIILLILCLIGCAVHRVNPLGHRRKLLLVRGMFGFGAIGGFLWAVSLLPLNDAQVLSFTAPIWAALLSPLLIGEHPKKSLAIVIAMCFLGVILITRPPFMGFDFTKEISALGVMCALGQALSSACAKMCVRELRSENPSVSVFYLSWVTVVAAGLVLVIQIVSGMPVHEVIPPPKTFLDYVLFLGVGFCSYGSQFCMTFALRYAKAAPALAMSYISIVATLLYGYFIFSEVPTVLSLLGALLVICASFLLGLLERGPEPVAADEDLKPLLASPSEAAQPLLQRSWSQASSSSNTSQAYEATQEVASPRHAPPGDGGVATA